MKNLNMSREIVGVASKLCIDLKSYRKIYSSVGNLYAWVYNETKEKNCLFDGALCHIGYKKLNKGFCVMKVTSGSNGFINMRVET